MSRLYLDRIIQTLIQDTGSLQPKNVNLSEEEIINLCFDAQYVLLRQPMLLDIKAPLLICGDIHGQYGDLLQYFEFGGYPPAVQYLFLGDYVDRGRQSIETICLLFAFKVKYPHRLHLLRGNHECEGISREYGFYEECKRRYNVKLWKIFTDCFNCLPVAAIVADKMFCCHGGLSPDLRSFDQIRKIQRPTGVPPSGLLCDLLWSDPDPTVENWGHNIRGVSYVFGELVVVQFVTKFNLDVVVRAHQMVPCGYEFFADKRLVTIFSARNYCDQFFNAGALMTVDLDLIATQITEKALHNNPLTATQKAKRTTAQIAEVTATKVRDQGGILTADRSESKSAD